MKFKIIIFFFLSFSITATAQIVLSDGGKIKIDGGTSSNSVFVVLSPPASNPIITNSTLDGIVMDNEYNRLQYNLSTTTTSITVPYMSALLEQMPITLVTNTAGIGSGNIQFSSKAATTRATGFDNLTYAPSDVTNMGSIGITNNSAKTIDRFWIIDANGYTTKPSVTLGFSYIDAEWAANGGNSISESNLQAQRFNTTLNDWGGYADFSPAGIINTTANTVSNISVSAANFFRSWTLHDNSTPLPIELLNFDAACINSTIVLNWCTATEKINDYFTLEQSVDGVNFTAITKVYGNGTTQQKHCYQTTANSLADINYFKLSQTDYNGTRKSFNIISINSCNKVPNDIVLANNGTKTVGVILNSTTENTLQLNVYNMLGQVIETVAIDVQQGFNNIPVSLHHVSVGLYTISISNSKEKLIAKKIVITDFEN